MLDNSAKQVQRCRMNPNPSPDPFRNTEPKNTAANQEPPLRALAIGSSGPAWTPLARASAENFNPNHDERGRFATSGGAAGQALHLGYTGFFNDTAATVIYTLQIVGSIAGYGFNSSSLNTCVVATIQTMIATKKQTRDVPDEKFIETQIETAAKGILTDPREGINWNNLGVSASPRHLAAIVQKVLENNGVQTTAQLGYDSAQELAVAIMASKQPVMISLQRAGTTTEHSVTVQWSPDAAGAGQGRFLMNNVTTKGETQGFTREQFERGQITANLRGERGSARQAKMMYYHIQHESAAIFTKAP